MTEHGDLDAGDVEVDVRDGEVTLRGTVDDRRQKWLTEDISDAVTGVRDVHNELKIRQRGQG